MKKHSKIASGLLALCMATALAVPASASNLDNTSGMDPDMCTGRGSAALIGDQARVTIEIGDCGGEWNSIWGWGRAYSGVWSWGNATYLYAKATVTADGQTAQTKTASATNTNEVVKTDKVYQKEKEGRQLKTSHTVRGYHGNPETGEYRNESYSGGWEF